MAQAGLLTLGSFYRLRLPGNPASGLVQLSSPITAAGPSPDFTGFPLDGGSRVCVASCPIAPKPKYDLGVKLSKVHLSTITAI